MASNPIVEKGKECILRLKQVEVKILSFIKRNIEDKEENEKYIHQGSPFRIFHGRY